MSQAKRMMEEQEQKRKNNLRAIEKSFIWEIAMRWTAHIVVRL